MPRSRLKIVCFRPKACSVGRRKLLCKFFTVMAGADGSMISVRVPIGRFDI